jgi:predicted porin
LLIASRTKGLVGLLLLFIWVGPLLCVEESDQEVDPLLQAEEPAGSQAEETIAEKALEEAVEQEIEAQEDPLAQREEEKAEEPEVVEKKPSKVDLYGSLRLRYRHTGEDWVLDDGGSRFGISAEWWFKPRYALFGRAEFGFNLLDELSFVFRPGDGSSARAGESVFLRLGYVGLDTPPLLLTLGKNWSPYYKVADFTDRFQGTGGRASGAFNAGTDGGPTGTGRADRALHARIQAHVLPRRWGLKPLGMNVQLQHGESIPHVGGKKYGTAFALSTVLETKGRLSIGLGYNRSQVDLDPEVRAAGIDGDAEALILGVRRYGEKWYAATTVARLDNHDSTLTGIYFDGWGWEGYGHRKMGRRFWLVGGWNWQKPDSDQTQAGPYEVRYGVLGVRYSFDRFRRMVFFNARLDSGTTSNGEPMGDVLTIGLRWDFR